MKDYTSLATTLISWLPTATPNQLLEYIQKLPPAESDLILKVHDPLLESIRFQRNRDVRVLLQSNATEVLSEPQLLRFILALSIYSPQSVITNFQKVTPELQAIPPSTPITDWANQTMATWDGVMYFFSAPLYDKYSVYMKSLCATAPDAETATAWHDQGNALVPQVVTAISEKDYEPALLPQELQHAIYTFLHGVSFFPDEYCHQQAGGLATSALYELLQGLNYVIEIYATYLQNDGKPEDQAALLSALWNQLRTDQEVSEIEAYELRRLSTTATSAKDIAFEQRFRKLVELVSLGNIQKGITKEYLTTYIGKLTPQQKKVFLEELEHVFVQSLDIQTLFQPVDVNYFIEQIKSQSLPGSKNDFIASLQPKIMPELWPVTQKAMQLIATIF